MPSDHVLQLIPHTFVFSCHPHGFWPLIEVLLITKALKEEAWALKYAFSVFVVKLYGFCLSIPYIARRRHPYIESLLTPDMYVPLIHKLNGLVHVLYSNKWQQRTKYLLLHDLIVRRDIFDECRGNVATFLIRLSTTCHCSTGGVHQGNNTPLRGSVCACGGWGGGGWGEEQFNLVVLRQILT